MPNLVPNGAETTLLHDPIQRLHNSPAAGVTTARRRRFFGFPTNVLDP